MKSHITDNLNDFEKHLNKQFKYIKLEIVLYKGNLSLTPNGINFYYKGSLIYYFDYSLNGISNTLNYTLLRSPDIGKINYFKDKLYNKIISELTILIRNYGKV